MSDQPTLHDDADIHCPECEYNLTGAPGQRCPWCGWRIDVDVLISSSQLHIGNRLAVAGTALIVSFLTLLATYALTFHSRNLNLFDMIAIAGATGAALAHAALAILVIINWNRRWPMRRGELGSLLYWSAWASIAAGVIGAIPALNYAPTKLVVQNTVVNGPLEFALSSILFTLPAWMLLLLLTIAFRPRTTLSPDRTILQSREGASLRSPITIDVLNRFGKHQITQSWTSTPRPANQSLDLIIAQTWDAETAIAREFNRALFNGELVSLIRCAESSQSLHLELGPTDYRDFIGTNLHNLNAALRLGPEYLSNALGVSGTVITSDGFLAFGRRSERVASHRGCLHPFGGMLERADQVSEGTFDVFGSARRELGEELELAPGEIKEVALVGIARDLQLLQPELIFDVTITLTRAQLIERFKPTFSHGEHERIEVVRDEPDCLLPFLEHTPAMTAIVQAAILIHGRQLWGREWYEQACYLLYGELPQTTITSLSQPKLP